MSIFNFPEDLGELTYAQKDRLINIEPFVFDLDRVVSILFSANNIHLVFDSGYAKRLYFSDPGFVFKIYDVITCAWKRRIETRNAATKIKFP